MSIQWHGIWIQDSQSDIYFHDAPPSPYFRTVVAAPKGFRRAVVRLCGLGLHELRINGVKADDRWYAPAMTQYDCRVGVIEYDVTALLNDCVENVLTVQLGSGFYNSRNHWKYTVNFYSWRANPRLICDVEIDGKVVESSGVHWKVHPGPIVFDCHHEGEDYDARLELPPSAFRADGDVSDWQDAVRALPPGGVMELEEDEPCRVLNRFPGSERRRYNDTLRLYDCKTNMSGVVELKCRGRRGAKVTLRYGEKLDAEGRVDTSGIDQNLERFDTDSYICKGEGVECWHPKFVWHGFRYVEVALSSPDIEIVELTGLFIGSDLKTRGRVETSDAVLDKVNAITLQSYRCNFMGLPTDCPTREKFGWTGDADMAMETGWWNFYQQNGLERLQKIIMDTQRPDGNFSNHGPTTLWGFEQTCPSFSAFLYHFCQYRLLFDGDDSAIRTYYGKLKLGVEFFENVIRDDALCHFGYGDWYHPDHFPGDRSKKERDATSVESLSLLDICHVMKDFAEYLGKKEDAGHFGELAERIASAIRAAFFDSQTALFDGGFWTSTAMALNFGVFDETEQQAVAAKLAALVRAEKHRAHIGIVGARNLPQALSENGYAEDAFTLLTQPEYPGWGNLVASGASTLWEGWNGANSRNHIMFGAPPAWTFRYAAGLSTLAPGFRRIRIAPCFVPQLDAVVAEYETPQGFLRFRWRRDAGVLRCHFEIPAGAVAEFLYDGTSREVTGTLEVTLS